jgi:hypothetical protein
MSHIVTIATEVRDEAAVQSACRRLSLEPPVRGSHDLYLDTAHGLAVRLPGWRYPAVFDTAAGQVRFDNFHGIWGEQVHLDRFLQAYAVEKATLEARRKGHAVRERALADGSIQLTVIVGGAA